MPNNTDLRKTLTDPTPLYFAAGVIEKVRTEAPDRIAKLRETDGKNVQNRVQEALSSLDADVKKWREQAQTLALQSVGYAAEAAVKAKENYDALAEQGRTAVEGWRTHKSDAEGTYTATIEREPVTVTEPADGRTKFSGGKGADAEQSAGAAGTKDTGTAKSSAASGTTGPGRRTTPRRATAARKTESAAKTESPKTTASAKATPKTAASGKAASTKPGGKATGQGADKPSDRS